MSVSFAVFAVSMAFSYSRKGDGDQTHLLLRFLFNNIDLMPRSSHLKRIR